jgi:hypothetical protein
MAWIFRPGKVHEQTAIKAFEVIEFPMRGPGSASKHRTATDWAAFRRGLRTGEAHGTCGCGSATNFLSDLQPALILTQRTLPPRIDLDQSSATTDGYGGHRKLVHRFEHWDCIIRRFGGVLSGPWPTAPSRRSTIVRGRAKRLKSPPRPRRGWCRWPARKAKDLGYPWAVIRSPCPRGQGAGMAQRSPAHSLS